MIKQRVTTIALTAALAALVGLVCGSATAAPPNTLKIYLLAGQSNMEGQAYTYRSAATDNWKVSTMDFLVSDTARANLYRDAMPNSTYTFEEHLNSSWLAARDDAWAVQYDSSNGSVRNVMPTNTGPVLSGIQALQPGFGVGTGFGSMIGAELAMGINLADNMQTPVFLFKSNKGGTDLAHDWRPPSATARSGSVGVNYTNTVNQFKSFLDTLDADLDADGVLNEYNNAVDYEVCGLVWLQGWNTTHGSQTHYSTAAKIAEYSQNLVDLVHDVRASDPRIPNDLGAIIVESSDQSSELNAQRTAAVATLNAEHPDSAAFVPTDGMIGNSWGQIESGQPVSNGWGYHFNARPENFLEIGWRTGQKALDLGMTGTDPAPEPATGLLLGLGALTLLRRRRRAA